MACIFNDPASMLISDCPKPFHIYGLTGKIYWDNSLIGSRWSRLKFFFESIEIHDQTFWFYINKVNFSPTIANAIDTGSEGKRS